MERTKRKLSTSDSGLYPQVQTDRISESSSNSSNFSTDSRTASPPVTLPPLHSVIPGDINTTGGSNDRDMFTAAQALTDLTTRGSNNSTPLPYQIPRLSPTTPLYSDQTFEQPRPQSLQTSIPVSPPEEEANQHPLVAQVTRVSKHPLVTNAVKYYDSSKKNFAPFNYAAEIVEKAAIPVVNKIEVNLNERYQARQAKQAQKKRKVDDKNTSQETTKRIQFCLHILKLANDRINSSVSDLQEKVTTREAEAKEKRLAAMSEQQEKSKTEIVTTVKKLIRLISNFRPSSLSTDEDETNTQTEQRAQTIGGQTCEIKNAIRDIILTLPAAFQQSSAGPQANDKVLVFAKESLDMISRLTNVFNDQLNKAEAWVNGDINQDASELESRPELKDEADVSSVGDDETLRDEKLKDIPKEKTCIN